MTAELHEMSTNHEWLPKRCPSWCRGDHAQVLAELGNDASCWRDAQMHRGPVHEGALHEVRNPASDYVLRHGIARYAVSCQQRPTHANGTRGCAEVIHLEAEQRNNVRASLDLLPSEARTLAAQLLHLADLMELEG